MDGSTQPSTFPWLFRQEAGTSSSLTQHAPSLAEEEIKAMSGSQYRSPCHPSLLPAWHQAGEDLGAAMTTQRPWGTMRTAKDPLMAVTWSPKQPACPPAAAAPCLPPLGYPSQQESS